MSTTLLPAVIEQIDVSDDVLDESEEFAAAMEEVTTESPSLYIYFA
ncbi:hypothetical protein [Nocardia gipuzkoensis]|nr:hypothetical protein [Nocardia gipuzkoensis]MDE1675320.1 hypothetical protein [Nocardia gipuzkoensis]